MLLSVHASCDMGMVRTNNEDMLLIAGGFVRDAAVDAEIDTCRETLPFFAVADGLGGAAAGELASETALRSFLSGISAVESGFTPAELRAHFCVLTEEAHRLLLEEGARNPLRRGMGTTLTGLLFHGGAWYWVNIGDSRAYGFLDGRLLRLSRDHTLREVTGRSDIPSNILANCLGGGAESVYCDSGGARSFPEEGGAFLLSSDGLHDVIGDRAIERLIAENPGNPVPELVNAAKEAGGWDNISCIYITLKSSGEV